MLESSRTFKNLYHFVRRRIVITDRSKAEVLYDRPYRQSYRIARDLKCRILEVERVYYLCSKNRRLSTAPLVSVMQKVGFLMNRLIYSPGH